MVGFVIVSYSENLAKSMVGPTSIMTSNVGITPTGDMDDGGLGTSLEKIQAAIESAYFDDGVLALTDLGNAVMTTETVIEVFGEKKVEMVDCPPVGGTVVITISAMDGMSFEDIKTALAGVGKVEKL